MDYQTEKEYLVAGGMLTVVLSHITALVLIAELSLSTSDKISTILWLIGSASVWVLAGFFNSLRAYYAEIEQSRVRWFLSGLFSPIVMLGVTLRAFARVAKNSREAFRKALKALKEKI